MGTPLDQLAAYFSGPMVAHHSIGLQSGGSAAVGAREFFEIREALGVRGYCSQGAARDAIVVELMPDMLAANR